VLGEPAKTATLKQLVLNKCDLLATWTDEAVAAALSTLPAGLEYLSIRSLTLSTSMSPNGLLPTDWVQQLQQLTYLELADLHFMAAPAGSPDLPLQDLTRLADLRLAGLRMHRAKTTASSAALFRLRITASMLSGAHHLTRLEVQDLAATVFL
jgi:hypothetical protein